MIRNTLGLLIWALIIVVVFVLIGLFVTLITEYLFMATTIFMMITTLYFAYSLNKGMPIFKKVK